MLESWVVLSVSLLYLCALFAIAYFGDKRAEQGRSLVANPYIYTLSIAVYCTSWTYYGSVGFAAVNGLGFLTIFLGPTLVFLAWPFLLGKLVRISKANRITSIADLMSSRYGKSTVLGGLVTVIAVIGIMPYISLQLKAVSTSFTMLLDFPDLTETGRLADVPIFSDTTLLVALVMALFAILFGTRHIDASEHHEGLVAAIAFESLVKLAAFLAVGLFVVYGLYDGFGDLFSKAMAYDNIRRVMVVEGGGDYSRWITMTVLSMAAIVCLPRQFHVTVVENVSESHLRKAVWLFPLYLLLINIFVLPIAVAGLLKFPGPDIDADTFVLTLPLVAQREGIALLAYIGGLAAATGMVIVAAIALSTMMCNNLIMPILLRIDRLKLTSRGDLTGLLLTVRRGSILFILLLGYAYYRFIGESYALVTIGLVSFAAAAQFAPAILAGIFWKGATRLGALSGLTAGFLVWVYTLLLPSFARSGWLPLNFVLDGPWGIEWLKPYALFGMQDYGHLTHSLIWSMMANCGTLITVSLFTRQSALERVQAALFVDAFRLRSDDGSRFRRGSATVADIQDLMVRFTGRKRAEKMLSAYAQSRGVNIGKLQEADADLVDFSERVLAGVIGSASASVMVSSVVKGAVVGLEDVMVILDETSQVIEYSHRLEQKSAELERTTAELRAANERLKELDRLKDEFLSTISHELRTPLTSIRSFSEILYDHPDVSRSQREEFLGIIIRESARLTRLINHILDLAKMEAGQFVWQMEDISPAMVIDEALAAVGGLFGEKNVLLDVDIEPGLPPLRVDKDRMIQVLVNLLANAVKFCDRGKGRVWLRACRDRDSLLLSVRDNGIGIPEAEQDTVFDKFRQVSAGRKGNPGGSGLGLAISRQIVEHFGGRIWVDGGEGQGACFYIRLPFSIMALNQGAA